MAEEELVELWDEINDNFDDLDRIANSIQECKGYIEEECREEKRRYERSWHAFGKRSWYIVGIVSRPIQGVVIDVVFRAILMLLIHPANCGRVCTRWRVNIQ